MNQVPSLDQNLLNALQQKREEINQKQQKRRQETKKDNTLQIRKLESEIRLLVEEQPRFQRRNDKFLNDVKQQSSIFKSHLKEVFIADQQLKTHQNELLGSIQYRQESKDIDKYLKNYVEPSTQRSIQYKIQNITMKAPNLANEIKTLEEKQKEQEQLLKQIEEEEYKKKIIDLKKEHVDSQSTSCKSNSYVPPSGSRGHMPTLSDPGNNWIQRSQKTANFGEKRKQRQKNQSQQFQKEEKMVFNESDIFDQSEDCKSQKYSQKQVRQKQPQQLNQQQYQNHSHQQQQSNRGQKYYDQNNQAEYESEQDSQFFKQNDNQSKITPNESLNQFYNEAQKRQNEFDLDSSLNQSQISKKSQSSQQSIKRIRNIFEHNSDVSIKEQFSQEQILQFNRENDSIDLNTTPITMEKSVKGDESSDCGSTQTQKIANRRAQKKNNFKTPNLN